MIGFRVHGTPTWAKASSDGQQTLDFDESAQLIRKLKSAFELIQSF